MHGIQCPRRSRNQPDIDQLVREFRDSGLNQRELAQKIAVHPLTVTRWIRTSSVDGAIPSASRASRVIGPTSPPRFEFETKFWDVIGLDLDPPTRAIVFCCDEKSQCQALERTQPDLPLGQGQVATRTHDYCRHGTVNLLTALNYLNGKILAERAPRYCH
jgi:hypothetical protein